MASKSEKQINSFIKGLITESNPLTFPENASLDESNFVLNRDGSRSRRLGIDYEEDFVLRGLGTQSVNTISYHEWRLGGGGSEISIGIVRVYNKLWFFNMLSRSPSSAILNGGNALTLSALSESTIEVTVINNACIIVSADLKYPVRLTYNKTTDTVAFEEYRVFVRDFWGVYDGLGDNERPTTLTTYHKYNLLNQGWSPTVQSSCGTEPIACMFSTIGRYPSNSDVWSVGKVADSASANYEKFSPTELTKRMHDFMLAPKGKHIIDVFDRGASRQKTTAITVAPTTAPNNGSSEPILNPFQGIGATWTLVSENTTNPTQSSTATPPPTSGKLSIDRDVSSFTTIASYAGRVFYSGVRSAIIDPDSKSPNLSSYVLFTQTVVNDDKLGRCYQEADPTSDEISDIIDSDGGAIHIPDAINIVSLVPTKAALIVFAENGVWSISGGSANFSATSYDLQKVSAIGCKNKSTIVAVNSEIFYWAKAGIFRIVFDETTGGLKSENLSLTSVQTLYNKIPDKGKEFCRAVFDDKNNTIRWLYNDGVLYAGESKYNRELVLDLTLGAFYPNTVDTSIVYIADLVKIPDYAESQSVDEVVVGVDPVVVTSLTEVVVPITNVEYRESNVYYLAVNNNYQFTFAKYRGTTFYDWVSGTGGINYSSYLVTGYEVFGEIMRKKYVPYLFVYLDRTENGYKTVGSNLELKGPSSCMVQAQWNWANSENSGKWGTPFQAYKLLRNYTPTGASDLFDYGDRVVVTKNKLRGSGKALSLKIYSEAGKDMKLLGWAMPVTGNSTP